MGWCVKDKTKQTMYNKAKNYTLANPTLRKTLGVILILVGFIALITPFTPGAAVFLIAGLELFGIKLVFLDRFLKRDKPIN